MEFRFNLNDIFKEPFVEIGNGLIPPGFTGDKRALWDTQSKITQIVNAMGEASAHAQGLSKPITTADRLRNSEHKLYLLIDQAANSGKGAVTGMLKTGEKGLYVFDREGQHYQVSPPCVLDFYIHESRQRSGYGKGLFEHMLQTQQIEPVKMAIDRPSDKLLGFLNKHYGLNSPVKQMNNYVVYDGFFPKSSEASRAVEVDKSYTPGKKQSANGLQHGISSSPYGRYGAPRPPCSMGQIIHNDTAVIKRNQEPTGIRSEPFANAQGQLNMYYSNQMPAWQATQSVPNMHYSYSQNPQNYGQTPQQYLVNQQCAQQYAQYQQFPQNVNAQYQPSSGDDTINATSQQMEQPVGQYQPQGQNLAQNSQNGNQIYQQAYYDNTMEQGDTAKQSHKDQDMITSTTEQMPSQNADQIQYQQASNPNEARGDQVQNQNVVQGHPQVFTYQGQTYCYNPQTQQYYMVPQQNLAPSVPQNQQVYYNQVPMQANNQISTQPSSQDRSYGQQVVPQHHREPLRPQNLDGTVRRVQQSVSMPVQKSVTQGGQNVPLMIHGTSSAPVSYQYQPAMARNQYNTGLDQADNGPTGGQGHQNQPVNLGVGQLAAPLQYQRNNQNVSMNPISNVPQENNQNFNVNPSSNIETTTQVLENVTQAPQAMAYVSQAIAQPLQAATPATHNAVEGDQVNTPRNPNSNTQVLSVNQPINNAMPAPHIQSVQQTPSMPQIAQNLGTLHQQQNIAYTQAGLQNQTSSHPTNHNNQPVSQVAHHPHSSAQNAEPLMVRNVVPVVESTHSRIHNVTSPEMSNPNTRQMMRQSGGISQSQSNQAIQNQHVQNVQTQNVPVQQPQQQMVHQQQQNLAKNVPVEQPQQQMAHQQQQNLAQNVPVQQPNENRNITIGQPLVGLPPTRNDQNYQYQQVVDQPQYVANLQAMGDHRFDHELNMPQIPNSKRGVPQERHAGGDEEYDLSRGYPPQHHERPAQNSTPKADRPQSLNIETVENREMKNNDQHKVEAELYEADAEAHEPLDGNYEDDDSLDGDQEDLEALEQNFEKIDVAPKETTPLSKGSRSPGMEAAGIVTPGRNTPGLTDQGYFDLKFYHNKLW